MGVERGVYWSLWLVSLQSRVGVLISGWKILGPWRSWGGGLRPMSLRIESGGGLILVFLQGDEFSGTNERGGSWVLETTRFCGGSWSRCGVLEP